MPCRSAARARGTTSAEAPGAARSKEGRRSTASAEIASERPPERPAAAPQARIDTSASADVPSGSTGREQLSGRTSSLRHRRQSIAVGVCAIALVTTPAALAAGGTPMPGPDDPPSMLTPSSTKTTSSSGSQTAKTSTKRTAESAVPVPDAPLVAAPVAAPRTSITPSVAAPTPDVVQRTAPRVATAPVLTRAAPKPAPTTTTISRAAAKPKTSPKAKPKPHPRLAPSKKAVSRPAGVPRDAVRLGLPAAVLGARPSDAELNGELLVAAALLLAAAAGGSLLL